MTKIKTLSGIANYLGVSKRTIQRWKKEFPMPIDIIGNLLLTDTDRIDKWFKKFVSSKKHLKK